MVCMYIYLHTHTVKYYSAIKRMKFAICNNRDGPEGFILSELSQAEKDKHIMLSLICGI